MAQLPPLVIFDDGLGLLSPLTDLRASFDVRTGVFTCLERFQSHASLLPDAVPMPAGLIVPEGIEALTSEKHRLPVNRPEAIASADGYVLLVNGACQTPSLAVNPPPRGVVEIAEPSGRVLRAHVPLKFAQAVVRGNFSGGLEVKKVQELQEGFQLPFLHRPWHVRAFRDLLIGDDLLHLRVRRQKDFRRVDAGGGSFALVAPTAKVHPSVIFDAEHGDIFIDDHAVIRPGAIIVGPAYIGPHSTVLERALIKANTAIGPHCKVAGEIGGTIFQGYANKSHDGHLGDSWIGEWANLGAGTTNSNLLNTYGDIVARPLGADGKPGSNERTGQQFLGATIGDHVKTAICTRIMTGAIVGTGTMFAASGPLSGTAPPLSWVTDSGTKPFAIDKFVEIAETVMKRRSIQMSAAYKERLRQLNAG